MVRSAPGRKLICKVKSVPRAILSSIVALQRGSAPEIAAQSAPTPNNHRSGHVASFIP